MNKKASFASACFLLSPLHEYLYKLVRTSGWTPGRLRCCCILTMWVLAPAGHRLPPSQPNLDPPCSIPKSKQGQLEHLGLIKCWIEIVAFLAVFSFVALRLFPGRLLTAVGQLDISQRLNLTNSFGCVCVRGAIFVSIPNTSIECASHNVTLFFFNISSILKWH